MERCSNQHSCRNICSYSKLRGFKEKHQDHALGERGQLMNFKKAIILFLACAAMAANADLSLIQVPANLLHEPNGAMSLGYMGKVEYSILAGGYDSINVTVQLLSLPDSAVQQLSEITGDVGKIRIVNPSAAEKKEVYFQYGGTPSGQYCIKIIAVAESSGVMKDIEVRLAPMSFNDKVTILGGNGMATYAAGGIPAITMADGPHGVRGSNATLFPCCSGLACTWDTALAFLQGMGKGHEFRAQGKNCSLGPALNLVYHPQQGRAFEYYSEDPWLSGKMAASDVRGLQSTGTIATVKHYACNQQESNRNTMSSVVDERSLQELYLKNFRRPVIEGGTIAVMSSYNKVNGFYATSNKYLIKIGRAHV
jgi:hypothetical protein